MICITLSLHRDLLYLLIEPSENQPENIAERLKKRRIAEFERFCFKKQFPKIPDEIIYPNSEAALQRR